MQANFTLMHKGLWYGFLFCALLMFFACFYQVILQVTACMILFWHVGKLLLVCH